MWFSMTVSIKSRFLCVENCALNELGSVLIIGVNFSYISFVLIPNCISTLRSTSFQGQKQGGWQGLHGGRFCSCQTRKKQNRRGLSAHVVIQRRRKRTRAVSTWSHLIFSLPRSPWYPRWPEVSNHLSKNKYICFYSLLDGRWFPALNSGRTQGTYDNKS